MADLTLTKEDKEAMVISLNMRINLMQTGDPYMSSESATKSGMTHLIKPLSDSQMEAILSMRKIIKALYSSDGKVRIISV